MSGVRWSEKHGVNPSCTVCFICGEDKGEIVLFGSAYRNERGEPTEAPHRICIDKEPCDKCKEHMKLGIILLEAKPSAPRNGEPVRTGRMWVMKEEAVGRIFDAEMFERVKKCRVAYIDEEAAKKIGLYDVPDSTGKSLEEKENEKA